MHSVWPKRMDCKIIPSKKICATRSIQMTTNNAHFYPNECTIFQMPIRAKVFGFIVWIWDQKNSFYLIFSSRMKSRWQLTWLINILTDFYSVIIRMKFNLFLTSQTSACNFTISQKWAQMYIFLAKMVKLSNKMRINLYNALEFIPTYLLSCSCPIVPDYQQSSVLETLSSCGAYLQWTVL